MSIFIKNFINELDIFLEKVQRTSMLVHILNQIAKFEAKF